METSVETNSGATVSSSDLVRSVTLHIVVNDRGCVIRIGHDVGAIYLDRDECLDLYNQLGAVLADLPVNLRLNEKADARRVESPKEQQ